MEKTAFVVCYLHVDRVKDAGAHENCLDTRERGATCVLRLLVKAHTLVSLAQYYL